MRYCYPDYLSDFRCLAGACPDTCCAGWDIVIDPETCRRYGELDSPVGQRLRAAMVEEDGEVCLKQEQGRCPMLTEEGLCALITAHGKELLSITCDSHPRFTEIYGGLEETALSVSCPAAASLLLQRQKPLFFCSHADDLPPQPNDLDGEQVRLLLRSRQTAFTLLQDRDYPLRDRLALLLCFAARLDRLMEIPTAFEALCLCYESPDYRDRELRRVRRLRRWGTMTYARQLFLAMEHLTEAFPTRLRELEAADPDRFAVPLEQLAVYYVFRWWLKAACGGTIWQQAAACVVGVLTVCGLARRDEDVEQAARLFSKEVEHSEENLALLRRAMTLPHFSRNRLLQLLEVPHAI